MHCPDVSNVARSFANRMFVSEVPGLHGLATGKRAGLQAKLSWQLWPLAVLGSGSAATVVDLDEQCCNLAVSKPVL